MVIVNKKTAQKYTKKSVDIISYLLHALVTGITVQNNQTLLILLIIQGLVYTKRA